MLDIRKMFLQEHSSVVKAIYTGSEFVAATSGDEDFGLVLASTSFYAEQGGQVHLLFTRCNLYIVD
jgi:alanyl-tRNA synthetase